VVQPSVLQGTPESQIIRHRQRPSVQRSKFRADATSSMAVTTTLATDFVLDMHGVESHFLHRVIRGRCSSTPRVATPARYSLRQNLRKWRAQIDDLGSFFRYSRFYQAKLLRGPFYLPGFAFDLG